jgi:YaiO family outer membrane protein
VDRVRALRLGWRCATYLVVAAYWTSAAHAQSDQVDTVRLNAERGELDRAEQLLTETLERNPEDAEARFQRARLRSRAGCWDGAAADYEDLLERHPEDADYWFGHGQVLLWGGSPRTAAMAAREARERAPNYEAAWRLELQALLATDDAQARATAEALVREARVRFPHSAWVLRPEPRAPAASMRAGVSVGKETLSNEFANWSSAVIDVEHNSAGRIVFARIGSTERFGLRDREYAAGMVWPGTDRWRTEIEVSHSPSANVLPDYSAMAGAHRRLASGWSAGINARHARYADTYTELIAATAERYMRNFRFSYQLFLGKANGGDATLSHVVRSDYYYGNGSSVGALLAHGEEQESLGGGRVINTKVNALAIIGEQRLAANWAMTWTISHHEQGSLYTRDGLGVGFRRRF